MISDSSSPAPFPTTCWDELAATGHECQHDRIAAVGRVICHYWRPIFRYLRSRGWPHHQAEALTQGFFVLLMCEEVFREARESRGRFRSFVLRILQRFLSDRGEGRGRRQAIFEARQLPFSGMTLGNDDSGYEPPVGCDPDVLFSSEWAESAVAEVMERLRDYYQQVGQLDWYDLFRLSRLADGAATQSQDSLAHQFGLTRDQVRYRVKMVHIRFEAALRGLCDDIPLGFRREPADSRRYDPGMNPLEESQRTRPWSPSLPAGIAQVNQLLVDAQTGEPELASLRGYDFASELGQGGMGTVFLLTSRVGNQPAALKVMTAQLHGELAERQQFHREVEVGRRLVHRNIVRLLSSGCHDQIDFHLTEFCDGGTLSQFCKRHGGRLPVDVALALMHQVLDGLAYAHVGPITATIPGQQVEAIGLVHRDLKPANIFLHGSDVAPVARIGDFGLAKAFDLSGVSGFSLTGARAGTPAFMPRQQVLNYKYAMPEVDVWAAAACLYYTLTGSPPREFPAGRDPWGVVLTDRPVAVRDRPGGGSVPKPLAELLDEAVADDPVIRYKTVAELRAALAGVV